MDDSGDVHAMQARIGALEQLQAKTQCKLESKEAEIAALRAQLSERAAQRGAAEKERGEPVQRGDESALDALQGVAAAAPSAAPAALDAAAVDRRSLLRSWIARNSEDFVDQADNKSDDLCFNEFERICHSYVDEVDRGVFRSFFDEMA